MKTLLTFLLITIYVDGASIDKLEKKIEKIIEKQEKLKESVKELKVCWIMWCETNKMTYNKTNFQDYDKKQDDKIKKIGNGLDDLLHNIDSFEVRGISKY